MTLNVEQAELHRGTKMRIGFLGTGGTGKTTSAKLLSTHEQLPYHPSVLRKTMEEWGETETSLANAPRETQWKFQKTVFDRKIEQDLTTGEGVFDRTLLDHLAYCLLRCSSLIDDSIMRSMKILVEENLQKYDFLYYFPLYNWEPKADGIREKRLASRTAIDLLIQGLLKETEVAYTTIPDTDPTTRTIFILQHLSLFRTAGGPWPRLRERSTTCEEQDARA